MFPGAKVRRFYELYNTQKLGICVSTLRVTIQNRLIISRYERPDTMCTEDLTQE